MPAAHVVVIGGGLAGLATSVALSGAGLRVTLLERHPRLGGRATSYLLPSGEYIDNCQHVTLRCCTNLENFYRCVGVAARIRYYDRLSFTDSKARRGEIRSSWLPAPLHLVPSFAAFPLLGWKDKRAVAAAMLRIIQHGDKTGLNQPVTMLEWLQQNHQTPNAIRCFWRVVLVSALNENLDRIEAAYGISVFWKAFLSNPSGFGVGIPSVPLEALYGTVADRIREKGGEVRTRCGVSELLGSNAAMWAVRLDNGTELKADYYIAAIPFDRLLKILPRDLRESNGFGQLSRLQSSPITSVHLWLDRAVMSEPFVASVDQTIQWVFNRTVLSPESTKQSGQYLQVVISASHDLKDLSQPDIVELCRTELAALFPEIRHVHLVHTVVVRENAATFSPQLGCDEWRLNTRTPVPNLLLAGDWTRTDWPATMESAVRSGYLAAEAVLSLEGKPARFLQPELPTSGFARWFV